MKRQYWFIMAALSLFLNGCCCVFRSHFSDQIATSDYDIASKGVNLYTPKEQIIFHDDDSFYFFAPVETFKRRWPLFSTSNSSCPKIVDIKKTNERLFVRVTPHKDSSPHVTIWIGENGLRYSIDPSPDGNLINVTLSGNRYAQTLSNLRPYNIDHKKDKDIESLFTRYRIPHRARVGLENGKDESNHNLFLAPVMIGSIVLDGTYMITTNLTNLCFRALMGGNGIGCSKDKQKSAGTLIDANVIWM